MTRRLHFGLPGRLAAVLWMAGAAQATELYSWHVFDTVAVSGPRFQLTLHSRIRTRDHFTETQQVRGGPVARFNLSRRVSILAGYYLQPGENAERYWGRGQRFFGGVEFGYHLKRLAVSTRFAAERHIFSHSDDYNRYRTSTRFALERRGLSPFYQVELLAMKTGFHSFRNGAGVRWNLSPRVSAEVSYCYDIRRTVYGGDRQAIVTALRFHKAE